MSVLRYQCLFSPLEKLPAFEQLIEELTRGGTTALYGPDDSQKAHLLAAAQTVWQDFSLKSSRRIISALRQSQLPTRLVDLVLQDRHM